MCYKELRCNSILTIIATRYQFSLIRFFNCYLVPLCLCWSVPTSALPKLYLLQCVFTTMLSVWLTYRLFSNTKVATHFSICVSQQSSLLCDYSENSLLDTDKSNGSGHYRTNDNSTINGGYKICPRSRCTQCCIFLILESEDLRVVSSTILFKWQLSDKDYRELALAIAQNKASARR